MRPSARPSFASHASSAARWIAGYLLDGIMLAGSSSVAFAFISICTLWFTRS
jgi:hypothetical protein